MGEATDRQYSAIRRQRTFSVAYEGFTRALEALLGTMDNEALSRLAGRSRAEAQAVLEGFVGPSGLALFQKLDHGALLTAFTGQATRALTYVLGNALIAIQMTRHVPMVGLYVPLRLYVREMAATTVLVTYDVPSATLAQFGVAAVDEVARGLDGKMEALLEHALATAAS
jgi:hypothetical protein